MLVVGIGLAVFQQFVGINTVIYYAPTIIESTGLADVASVLATVGIGVVNVLMTIVAILVIDRVGRKPLFLLVGLAGMTVSLVILGAAFAFSGLSGIISWVTLAGLMLYIASFAVSFGPVLWVMLPEIFPLKARGTGRGVWLQQLGGQFRCSPGVPAAGCPDRQVSSLLDTGSNLRHSGAVYPIPGAGDQGRSLEQIELRPAK